MGEAGRAGRVVAQVLVSGGAGYLGSVLCRELLERGHRVRALDALLYGAASLAGLVCQPGFSLVAGDTRDPRALAEALDGATAWSTWASWSAIRPAPRTRRSRARSTAPPRAG